MAKDGSVYRYGTWYALPESHTEHEKYKNTLRFSTSPSAVCYDPSKKIKYGYGDGASGWNYDESGRYSFSSKNGALSEDDEKYLDQYEGYANKDGVGSTVYDIGGTHYTLDDLVYLELRDIQTIVESDPDGASVLLKDLIEHASIYSQ
jgi:molecular chaperone DnaK (HSP70)